MSQILHGQQGAVRRQIIKEYTDLAVRQEDPLLAEYFLYMFSKESDITVEEFNSVFRLFLNLAQKNKYQRIEEYYFHAGDFFAQHGYNDSSYLYNSKGIKIGMKNILSEKDSTLIIVRLKRLHALFNNAGLNLMATTSIIDTRAEKNELGPILENHWLKADSINDFMISIASDCYENQNSSVLNLANLYSTYYVDTLRARLYYEKAFNQLKHCQDTLELMHYYGALSLAYKVNNDTAASLAMAKRVIQLDSVFKSDAPLKRKYRYEANYILSVIHFQMQDFFSAYKYGIKALTDTVYASRKDYARSRLYHNLAHIALERNLIKEAKVYLNEAHKHPSIEETNQRVLILQNQRSETINGTIEKLLEKAKAQNKPRLSEVAVLTMIIITFTSITLAYVLIFKMAKRKSFQQVNPPSDLGED